MIMCISESNEFYTANSEFAALSFVHESVSFGG
jgi:hypothetical protein